MGNPQTKFKSIHIGGTNGKGSTSALTASILRAAGYKVGLYTSPHLENFRERIQVDGEMIPEEDVTRLLIEVRTHFDKMLVYESPMPLRFFDIVTAVCFKYFMEKEVDYAVIEVGLGGRLDATNVLNPEVSVITNIGYEHVNILGPTLEDIAFEKAGIIKPETPLVTAELNPSVIDVFKKKVLEVSTSMVQLSDGAYSEKIDVSPDGQKFTLRTRELDYGCLVLPLFGEHQITNAATAVAAIETLGLNITTDSVRAGLKNVKWPGRLEVLSKEPLIVLDCAKDAEATSAVRETIQSDFDVKRIIAVVSISSDKNIEGMIKNIAEIADHFIITKHSITARAAEPKVIIAEIEKAGRTSEVHLEQPKAFDRAVELVEEDGMVLVIGSVYLAGDARAYLSPRLSPE